MTTFESKRLDFLLKAAEKCEWIQLGHGDINLLEFINKNIKDAGDMYEQGYNDGYEQSTDDMMNNLDNLG